MKRVSTCGSCESTNVKDHCQDIPEDNCPWVRCDDCGCITDHCGRTYMPPVVKPHEERS